jgi:chromosome segregation ATPase
MTDKFQSELADLENSEKELKNKFTQAKAEVLGKEEEIFSLKTSLGLKEKQVQEVTESNMKMLEERANLTSIIRREFASQIETLEEECRGVKLAVTELKAKHKHDLETHALELKKLRGEKEVEVEKIGLKVKQALGRKEETIQELSKQVEKAQIRINHLEDLLEQQRKDFVSSMTTPAPAASKKK